MARTDKPRIDRVGSTAPDASMVDRHRLCEQARGERGIDASGEPIRSCDSRCFSQVVLVDNRVVDDRDPHRDHGGQYLLALCRCRPQADDPPVIRRPDREPGLRRPSAPGNTGSTAPVISSRPLTAGTPAVPVTERSAIDLQAVDSQVIPRAVNFRDRGKQSPSPETELPVQRDAGFVMREYETE